MTKPLEERLEEARKNLEEVLREKAAWDALTPITRLTIDLHDKFCHHNHADQCDWFYHVKNGVPTGGHAYGRYQHKALVLTKFCEVHNISEADIIGITKVLSEG